MYIYMPIYRETHMSRVEMTENIMSFSVKCYVGCWLYYIYIHIYIYRLIYTYREIEISLSVYIYGCIYACSYMCFCVYSCMVVYKGGTARLPLRCHKMIYLHI